jgi:hypothetical protein
MPEKMSENLPENKREGGKNKANVYVFESFHQLGFKIEAMPELYERLIELAGMEKSHFQDAVHMALMVDEIWADLEHTPDITFNKNELKLACLFHDIGKSGPETADREERRLIQMLFNSKYFSPRSKDFEGKGSPKDMTIEQALILETKISEEDKKKIKDYLETLEVHIYHSEIKESKPDKKKAEAEKLDIKKHKMIDFWREHDYWTYNLLKSHGNHLVTKEVRNVASTHHALEGHDPAAVDGFITAEGTTMELVDKYTMITLIDKYQAWIERSGKSHADAIIELRNQIKMSRDQNIISDKVAKQYYKYLEILAKHENLPKIVNPIK